tara:strand:- start:799 stop:1437 length:639 start_codon:yes stop_codon:yes gene_type:complete
MVLNIPNNKKLEDLLQVSRETIKSLNIYEEIILKNNKKINLISKSTENNIKTRHILDSSQVIDFIDKNCNNFADLGSGAGFPGIVLAILIKDRNYKTRVDLYEKSPRKCEFLSKVVKELNLNALVFEKNLFLEKNLRANTIVARAFKPIQIVFEVVTKNFQKFENLILFLGKNGKQNLLDASKVWEFEYKGIKSITSSDSLIVNVKKIRKKI